MINCSMPEGSWKTLHVRKSCNESAVWTPTTEGGTKVSGTTAESQMDSSDSSQPRTETSGPQAADEETCRESPVKRSRQDDGRQQGSGGRRVEQDRSPEFAALLASEGRE
ncbi:hypothetical protein PR002_g26658 [Phytophthora rubi]|uniref:Uncharacterized protein n=1 Tax=Phytophthora rubi TaxID=129364 RepID=A0A6A3HQN6_9STRA|nr:hypothetical protein PR002_g26658 [Phytophthora rubi]